MDDVRTYTIHDLSPDLYELIVVALDFIGSEDATWAYLGSEKRMKAQALAERLRHDLNPTP